jgi:hypothetical protein
MDYGIRNQEQIITRGAFSSYITNFLFYLNILYVYV